MINPTRLLTELNGKRHKLLFLITEDWYFLSHRLPVARAARDRGLDVVIATRVNTNAERILGEGFRLVPLGLSRMSRNPLKECSSILELVRIFRRERPDIVHNVGMKPVLYGTIAARSVKVPYIVNALAGLGYVFTSRGESASVLRNIMSIALRLLLNHKNGRLIIQNRDDIQLLVGSNIAKKENIVLIEGSGVDLNEFSQVPEPDGEPLVVLVSRMLRDKGIQEFVDAAVMLSREGTKARFALIGKPDPDNPSSIPTATLESWHSQGVVEWWGYREDVPSILQKSHVVCLPSYREGLPKVLIEAASCGRPIVTTDTPGCREIVKDGYNGFLVPARDAEALAKALGRLIRDPLTRKEMGRRGRDIAAEKYSVEKVIGETMKLYEDLLLNS